MYPLERFTEDDVNESATVAGSGTEGYSNPLNRFFFSLWVLNLLRWLFSLLGDKAKVSRKRQRVRELRAEVLPRAPNSLICPNCLEFLER